MDAKTAPEFTSHGIAPRIEELAFFVASGKDLPNFQNELWQLVALAYRHCLEIAKGSGESGLLTAAMIREHLNHIQTGAVHAQTNKKVEPGV